MVRVDADLVFIAVAVSLHSCGGVAVEDTELSSAEVIVSVIAPAYDLPVYRYSACGVITGIEGSELCVDYRAVEGLEDDSIFGGTPAGGQSVAVERTDEFIAAA